MKPLKKEESRGICPRSSFAQKPVLPEAEIAVLIQPIGMEFSFSYARMAAKGETTWWKISMAVGDSCKVGIHTHTPPISNSSTLGDGEDIINGQLTVFLQVW